MWPNPHGTADLVTFAEGILNGKLHFCELKQEFLTKGKQEFYPFFHATM